MSVGAAGCVSRKGHNNANYLHLFEGAEAKKSPAERRNGAEWHRFTIGRVRCLGSARYERIAALGQVLDTLVLCSRRFAGIKGTRGIRVIGLQVLGERVLFAA